MNLNPEHNPNTPPAPFTEDEWFAIATCIGLTGTDAEDDPSPSGRARLQMATYAAVSLKRVVGLEYITYLKSIFDKKVAE